jgi:hypothetical protein
LAWQCCKIRNKNKDDKLKVFQKRVLTIDLGTGKLAPLTPFEMDEFKQLEERASKLRDEADKHKNLEYSNSDGIQKLKAIITNKLNEA